MIKTFANLNGFHSYEIYQAITDVNIRKQWDNVFSELKVIDFDPVNNTETVYMLIKSPTVFVSDRDFVQQRKKWVDFPEKDSIMIHYRSVPNNKMPIKNKIIRGEIIISGYLIKTISYNPPKSFLLIISQTDIKVNILILNNFLGKHT
jgi:hypothetical protein